MEIEKAKENNLLALNSKSMEILQKCHTKVLEIKPPEKPEPLPKSLIIGWVDGEDKEFFTSLMTFGALLITSMVSGANGDSIGVVLAISAGAGSLFALTNTVSIAVMGERSLAYRIQKLWRRVGLPARKLQTLEKKQVEQIKEYLQQMDIYQKKGAKINKQVKPELKRINAHSKEFTFEFGMQGLISTRRKIDTIHPSFADLAKEIGI